MKRILLYGYSSGGQGVPVVVTNLEGYFNKAIVIDGGNSEVKLSDVQIPMKGYAGESNQGDYMRRTFAGVVGDENVTNVKSTHGLMLENSYSIDENDNGISDMMEWAFSSDGESELEQETELTTEVESE